MKWIQERNEERRQMEIQERICKLLQTREQRRLKMDDEELQQDKAVETQMIQFLRDRNIRRQELNSQLEKCIDNKDYERAEYLLACGADPNSGIGSFEGPILMKCVKNNDDNMIQLFVNSGADPTYTNEYNINCLQLAIRYKFFSIFESLFKKSSPENVDLNLLIMECIVYDSIDILRYLLTEFPFLKVNERMFNIAQNKTDKIIVNIIQQYSGMSTDSTDMYVREIKKTHILYEEF